MIRLAKDDALEELAAERNALMPWGGCAMCRLSDPVEAQLRIAETAHGVVTLDQFAARVGHLLVISKEHVERGTALDYDAYMDLQALAYRASSVVEDVLQPARVYVASLGSAKPLPTSFPHFHVHVIPVYETDERARPAHVFSWSSGVVRYRGNEAAQLVARLRNAWQRRAA